MQAKIAEKAPAGIELEAGKTYFWCSCGHSQKQPFCDGSHRAVNESLAAGETKFEPLKFSAEKTGKAWLCQCKQTQSAPFCDGTHKKI